MEYIAYLHNIMSSCWELKWKFRLRLERDPIFIKDDKFYTTAGVAQGAFIQQTIVTPKECRERFGIALPVTA
jgi:hypothetical protein